MGFNERQLQIDNSGANLSSSATHQNSSNGSINNGTDKDEKYAVCRVCQCVEPDRRGDAALGFLDIIPPLQDVLKTKGNDEACVDICPKALEHVNEKKVGIGPGLIEFISPGGEIFVCHSDMEAGSCYQQDMLINLGCSCKNDLSLAHYSCALKWFINHGSSICEICGSQARNIRPEDLKKVMASLKEHELLRERTATGECTHAGMETNTVIDPDAVAAIRRQRLSEISMWFNPFNNTTAISQAVTNQSSVDSPENAASSENRRTRWAVEGTGILVATGLLTVTLAWLIAPRVGKKTAKNGLHILLGGLCALTVVIFLRFIVLSRIKYGPARYWAILFVFWFLVFGIWASRTHGVHTT